MTKEEIINYEGEINFSLLKKRLLDDSDITDKNTDRGVSLKLIDDKNNILMLIEACAINRTTQDDEFYNKGCFIKRFLFEKRLVNTSRWNDVLASFCDGLKYSMVNCVDNGFKCRYKYVWAQKETGVQCVIAEVLGLEPQDDIITYVGKIPN